jgi:hypothetical protein
VEAKITLPYLDERLSLANRANRPMSPRPTGVETMVEPTLEFLQRNLRMIQLDQRQMRSEMQSIHTKVDVLSDKFDLLMEAFGNLEAAIRKRFDRLEALISESKS